jgi:uncharacterized integral membrane protein
MKNKEKANWYLKTAEVLAHMILTVVLIGLNLISLNFPIWLFISYLIVLFFVFIIIGIFIVKARNIIFTKSKK